MSCSGSVPLSLSSVNSSAIFDKAIMISEASVLVKVS